jgi:hypothetical protein
VSSAAPRSKSKSWVWREGQRAWVSVWRALLLTVTVAP